MGMSLDDQAHGWLAGRGIRRECFGPPASRAAGLTIPEASAGDLAAGWLRGVMTTALRVVVVAPRKLDEGPCLVTDSPGVMAGGKEHHVPRREVFLRAVAQDHPQCARRHQRYVRQLALVCPGIRLQVLRPLCASLEGHLGNGDAIELSGFLEISPCSSALIAARWAFCMAGLYVGMNSSLVGGRPEVENFGRLYRLREVVIHRWAGTRSSVG